MPAVKLYPRNSNQAAFDAGLVLISSSGPSVEVDGNEFGMEETTLRFETALRNWPAIIPVRGTPCSDFKFGDDMTAHVLRRELPFLGKQTHRFIRKNSLNAIIEMVCQGAIFADPTADPGDEPVALDLSQITLPFPPSSSTKDTVEFKTYKKQGNFYIPLYNVTIDYYAIDLHYEYMARAEQEEPRFVQTDYERDANGFILLEETESGQRKKKLIIECVSATSVHAKERSNGAILIEDNGTTAKLSEADWLPWVNFQGTGSQFECTPAGQFWHVLETTTIKIQPNPPLPGAQFGTG